MSYKKIPLAERLGTIHPLYSKPSTINLPVVRRSLEERLSGAGSSTKVHRAPITKHPLKDRLRKVEDGESYAEIDLTPYVEMINVSANVPLKDMMCSIQLSENQKMLSPSMTYREASRTIFDRLAQEEILCMPSDITALPDAEYNTFFVMWDTIWSDYDRRRGQNTEKRIKYKDISALFPALTIPLPTYFKAAATTFTNPYLKDYLNSLYSEVFRPLLSVNPSLSRQVKTELPFQPNKKTCYSDPITMIATLSVAYKEGIIDSQEKYSELIYDIIILPYLAL